MDGDVNRLVTDLSADAEWFQILTNCLDVVSQLQRWATDQDEIAGGDAANALDQARGMLERLTPQRVAELSKLVDDLLETLPGPWE